MSGEYVKPPKLNLKGEDKKRYDLEYTQNHDDFCEVLNEFTQVLQDIRNMEASLNLALEKKAKLLKEYSFLGRVVGVVNTAATKLTRKVLFPDEDSIMGSESIQGDDASSVETKVSTELSIPKFNFSPAVKKNPKKPPSDPARKRLDAKLRSKNEQRRLSKSQFPADHPAIIE